MGARSSAGVEVLQMLWGDIEYPRAGEHQLSYYEEACRARSR
jgi:hypothetical protein